MPFRKIVSMSTVQHPSRILEEIADLFASCPNREQLLGFRPSSAVQQRASELLAKQNDGTTTDEEQRELDQYEQAEVLMRLVKARLKTQASP